MSRTVVRQIADLERLSVPELQDRWRQLMGGEPPRYTREFLVRRLAYRVQELTYGGLSQAARTSMDRLLEEAGYDELGARRGSGKSARTRHDAPLIGTRLIREWNGTRYEVTVVLGGYEFEGRRYRSLSAIARAITGTQWNGPNFFGLRAQKRSAGQ